MTITELVEKAHENARKHGFWEDWDRRCSSGLALQDDYNNAIATRLMLIVSELGEALEGLRYSDMANFKEELADVAIRLADLCGGLGIDLESEVEKKMKKNRKRGYKHGKAF